MALNNSQPEANKVMLLAARVRLSATTLAAGMAQVRAAALAQAAL